MVVFRALYWIAFWWFMRKGRCLLRLIDGLVIVISSFWFKKKIA